MISNKGLLSQTIVSSLVYYYLHSQAREEYGRDESLHPIKSSKQPLDSIPEMTHSLHPLRWLQGKGHVITYY